MSMPLPPKGKHLFGIVTVGDKWQIVIPAKGIRALRYEKDDSFKGSIGNIYQSFAGQEIYPSLQEKAANLLLLLQDRQPMHLAVPTSLCSFVKKNKK